MKIQIWPRNLFGKALDLLLAIFVIVLLFRVLSGPVASWSDSQGGLKKYFQRVWEGPPAATPAPEK